MATKETLTETPQGISYIYRSGMPSGTHQYLHDPVSRFLEDIPVGASVIDVGCGNGSFLALFRNKGWRLFGADLSPTGIELARTNYPEISFFLLDVQNNLNTFAMEHGEVDVILSTEVIEHLYDPRSFLRSCFDILKPGGVLVISTPYHGYLKNLALALANRMDRHFTALYDHGHIKFFSRETFSEALLQAGFTDLQFAGAGRVPWFWKSMVFRCRKP